MRFSPKNEWKQHIFLQRQDEGFEGNAVYQKTDRECFNGTVDRERFSN